MKVALPDFWEQKLKINTSILTRSVHHTANNQIASYTHHNQTRCCVLHCYYCWHPKLTTGHFLYIMEESVSSCA